MTERIRIPTNLRWLLPAFIILVVMGILTLLGGFGVWEDENAASGSRTEAFIYSAIAFLIAAALLVAMLVKAKKSYFVLGPEGLRYEETGSIYAFALAWEDIAWIGIEVARIPETNRSKMLKVSEPRVRVLFTGHQEGWEERYPVFVMSSFPLAGTTRAMSFGSNTRLIEPLRSTMTRVAPNKFAGVFDLGTVSRSSR
ncbi:hypothetical protein VR010_09800 [Actinomycetaceae bacterium L2_0104]